MKRPVKSVNGKPSCQQQANDQATTSLHQAAASGTAEEVKQLIDNGMSVDTENAVDQTPLHVAIMNQNKPAILALIAAGASLKLPDVYGQTPLALASNNIDILETIYRAIYQKLPKQSDDMIAASSPLLYEITDLAIQIDAQRMCRFILHCIVDADDTLSLLSTYLNLFPKIITVTSPFQLEIGAHIHNALADLDEKLAEQTPNQIKNLMLTAANKRNVNIATSLFKASLFAHARNCQTAKLLTFIEETFSKLIHARMREAFHENTYQFLEKAIVDPAIDGDVVRTLENEYIRRTPTRAYIFLLRHYFATQDIANVLHITIMINVNKHSLILTALMDELKKVNTLLEDKNIHHFAETNLAEATSLCHHAINNRNEDISIALYQAVIHTHLNAANDDDLCSFIDDVFKAFRCKTPFLSHLVETGYQILSDHFRNAMSSANSNDEKGKLRQRFDKCEKVFIDTDPQFVYCQKGNHHAEMKQYAKAYDDFVLALTLSKDKEHDYLLLTMRFDTNSKRNPRFCLERILQHDGFAIEVLQQSQHDLWKTVIDLTRRIENWRDLGNSYNYSHDTERVQHAVCDVIKLLIDEIDKQIGVTVPGVEELQPWQSLVDLYVSLDAAGANKTMLKRFINVKDYAGLLTFYAENEILHHDLESIELVDLILREHLDHLFMADPCGANHCVAMAINNNHIRHWLPCLAEAKLTICRELGEFNEAKRFIEMLYSVTNIDDDISSICSNNSTYSSQSSISNSYSELSAVYTNSDSLSIDTSIIDDLIRQSIIDFIKAIHTDALDAKDAMTVTAMRQVFEMLIDVFRQVEPLIGQLLYADCLDEQGCFDNAFTAYREIEQILLSPDISQNEEISVLNDAKCHARRMMFDYICNGAVIVAQDGTVELGDIDTFVENTSLQQASALYAFPYFMSLVYEQPHEDFSDDYRMIRALFAGKINEELEPNNNVATNHHRSYIIPADMLAIIYNHYLTDGRQHDLITVMQEFYDRESKRTQSTITPLVAPRGNSTLFQHKINTDVSIASLSPLPDDDDLNDNRLASHLGSTNMQQQP